MIEGTVDRNERIPQQKTQEKPLLREIAHKGYTFGAIVPTMEHLSVSVSSMLALLDRGLVRKFVLVADPDDRAMIDNNGKKVTAAELAKRALLTIKPEVSEEDIEIIEKPHALRQSGQAMKALHEYQNMQYLPSEPFLLIDPSNDRNTKRLDRFGLAADCYDAKQILEAAGVPKEVIESREATDRIEDELRRKGELPENILAQLNLGIWGDVPYHDIREKSVKRGFAPLNPIPMLREHYYGMVVMHDPEVSEKLLQELNNPELIDGLNVTKANWSEEKIDDDEAVTVYLPLYGNANNKDAEHNRKILLTTQPDDPRRKELNEDECTQRLRKIAEKFADTTSKRKGKRVIAFDHPSMGGSDPLTQEQKDALRNEHNLVEIAKRELQVLKDMGVKKINLTGQSMGAFASLAMALQAREYGITVENLVLFEIPMEMPQLMLMLREVQQFGALNLHHSHPSDVQMAQGTNLIPKEEKPSLMEQANAAVEGVQGMLNNDPEFLYAAAMARGTVAEDIKELLRKSPETRIVFVNGSESTVSPLNKIKQIVADNRKPLYAQEGLLPEDVARILRTPEGEYDAQKKKIKEINQRLRVAQFPGFNHIGMVNPNINAALVDIFTRSNPKQDDVPLAMAV